MQAQKNIGLPKRQNALLRELSKNKYIYIMLLPVFIYYIMFHYIPMCGVLIGFQDYSPRRGIFGSDWVGMKNFIEFFTGPYFWQILRNTLKISLSSIVFGFPAPIILALLLNELRVKAYSRVVQTVTYLPHFISTVVVCGLVKEFTMDTGVVNDIIAFFGGTRSTMLIDPHKFLPVYIISDIWQKIGWDSIIYLAALTSIDMQLYEAADIDGAKRFRKMISITLPSILPTVITMLILRIGNILNVGFEKIILLYNPSIYDTADVISTYVYRVGLQEYRWGYSTAVGLFNSVVNFGFLILANCMSKRFNDVSLW